jgi:hypothetical protein
MESNPHLSSIKIDILRRVGKVQLRRRRQFRKSRKWLSSGVGRFIVHDFGQEVDLGLGVPLNILHGHICFFTSFRLTLSVDSRN